MSVCKVVYCPTGWPYAGKITTVKTMDEYLGPGDTSGHLAVAEVEVSDQQVQDIRSGSYLWRLNSSSSPTGLVENEPENRPPEPPEEE